MLRLFLYNLKIALNANIWNDLGNYMTREFIYYLLRTRCFIANLIDANIAQERGDREIKYANLRKNGVTDQIITLIYKIYGDFIICVKVR